jgi:hypothetical protein
MFIGLTNIQAQTRTVTCSEKLNQVSYFWKLDSLGTNGLRYWASFDFLDVKIDTLYYEDIITALGRPNQKWEGFRTDKATLVYHTLDAAKLPKVDLPYACYYIAFVFDTLSKRVISVYTDNMDR